MKQFAKQSRCQWWKGCKIFQLTLQRKLQVEMKSCMMMTFFGSNCCLDSTRSGSILASEGQLSCKAERNNSRRGQREFIWSKTDDLVFQEFYFLFWMRNHLHGYLTDWVVTSYTKEDHCGVLKPPFKTFSKCSSQTRPLVVQLVYLFFFPYFVLHPLKKLM